MSKILILVRHGDAEQVTSSDNDDLHRKLTAFGEMKIKRLANFITKQELQFDKIISSHAVRTSSTARIILNAIDNHDDIPVDLNKSLYNGKFENYVSVIDGLKDNVNTLMIVGHSPIITEFGEYIAGKLIGYLQPGGIICINLKSNNWLDIHRREGNLIFVKNFLQGTLELA